MSDVFTASSKILQSPSWWSEVFFWKSRSVCCHLCFHFLFGKTLLLQKAVHMSLNVFSSSSIESSCAHFIHLYGRKLSKHYRADSEVLATQELHFFVGVRTGGVCTSGRCESRSYDQNHVTGISYCSVSTDASGCAHRVRQRCLIRWSANKLTDDHKQRYRTVYALKSHTHKCPKKRKGNNFTKNEHYNLHNGHICCRLLCQPLWSCIHCVIWAVGFSVKCLWINEGQRTVQCFSDSD